jgi:hypothetical protein
MWSRLVAPGQLARFRCTEDWLWAVGPAGIVYFTVSALAWLGRCHGQSTGTGLRLTGRRPAVSRRWWCPTRCSGTHEGGQDVTARMQRCGQFSFRPAERIPGGRHADLDDRASWRRQGNAEHPYGRPGWRTPVRRPDRLGPCLRAGSRLIMKGVASASFIAAGRAER